MATREELSKLDPETLIDIAMNQAYFIGFDPGCVGFAIIMYIDGTVKYDNVPIEAIIIPQPEPKLYYKRRIWYKSGNITETHYYLDDNLDFPGGTYRGAYTNIEDVVKSERIGEGAALVEGQIGYEKP